MPHEHAGKSKERLNGQNDPNRIISKKLKELYSAVEEEGIPDRFLSLLEKLDAAEKNGAPAAKHADE
ncbi:NepR family anti-sigma factor [Pseudohoeflea coraliihabitans]|uniref:Anti-sigma factor NepR domain-containing protein n=1 Tax=Pseudohoeflea coraliihabitans TaxID=2860393 RepID=A0ABS6WN06_9HYPH|nr:NepR family anti-sigma factor [Pseudohoeflea sp. DP4N28-3]MBW3097285.1 hypothetical protein [Pseudohoeflea sp. DP4N28-3]